MAGTIKRLYGPAALTATLTTNIYNGAGGSALIYDVVRHIHIVNKTSGSGNFTIYLGATGANAAGTELWVAKNIPANDAFDWYGAMKLTSSDFLVGGANALTTLVITIMGEQYVV